MTAASQSPQQVALALEQFLAEHPSAILLEEGRIAFDMRQAKYSLSQQHDRCTLQVWSDERNLVRRVLSAEPKRGALRLSVMRFGQAKPQTLELVATPDRRTTTARDSTRSRYAALLTRVLQREFPDWTMGAVHKSMDLERSFGPAYARALLTRGQQAWAIAGVNAEETSSTIDGVLTVGLLWLQLCRERSGGRQLVQGLRIVVPRGTAATTLSRMAWLRPELAQWELYELDERTEELVPRDLADTGNLQTRLQHAPDLVRARERFAPALERVLHLVPAESQPVVEQRLRSTSEMALLLHGLEFARIRLASDANSFAQKAEISFGAGPNETQLDDSTEPLLRSLVQRLFASRRPGGSHKDPLFRMAPEAWLEAELRRSIGALTAGQSSLSQFQPEHVYAQVPAFQAADHGTLDLLTVTNDLRLAVLELKADEDMHFALQGLDYWVRVRWHHTQTVDAATGLGAFQRHGYFTGLRLSSEPPRLYFVAPALRIHPVTETVLRFLKPEVEWTLIGLGEHWRTEMQIVFRKTSRSVAGRLNV